MALEQYLKNDAGRVTVANPITSTAGAADGGKIIAADETTGKLHSSFMPSGVGETLKQVEASEAIGDGEWVNFFDDAGTIKIRKADATVAGKEAEGWCDGAVSSGGTASVKGPGTINGKLTGLTQGAAYFLGTTAGGQTATAPSGDGNVQQYIGKAVSATELWFQPDERGIVNHT